MAGEAKGTNNRNPARSYSKSPGKHTILAKLTAPRLVPTVPRKRLFRQIDQTRCQSTTVWLAAPAGSGKTTLVLNYLKSSRLRHLWYQIDERDTDPATFFYYLRESAAQVSTRAHRILPLLTPEYSFGLEAYAQNFFSLLGTLFRSPIVLVLDNYQKLPDDSVVHALLAEGLRVQMEPACAFLLSHKDPPPAYAGLQAQRQLAVLDGQALSLSLEETQEMAERYHFAHLAPAAVANLHARTRGWAAGTVLMLEQASQEGNQEPRFDQPVASTMFNYFASEVLHRAPAAHQQVLLKTAILPQVSANLAVALTGEDEAEHMLAELARRHYFTYRLPGNEPVYQYHPLFREFLYSQLLQTTGAQEITGLRRSAAEMLEASGNAEDAVQLWSDAGAWDRLAAAACAQALTLLTQGRWKTLVEWIERLPEAMRTADPGVAYWLGMALVPFDPPRARASLSLAYHMFKQAGATEPQWRAWCGVVDSFVFEWRDFHPLNEWIVEFENELGTTGNGLSADLDAHIATGMFMALMNCRPQHPDMERWAERAWNLAIGGSDPVLRLKTGPHLLLYYTWWIGNLNKAELLLNALRPYAEDTRAPPLVQITWCAMAGAYYWMHAENASCIALVERGLALADANGVHVWDMLLCSHGMFATLTSGHVEEAQVYAQRMAQLQDPARTLDSAAYYYLTGFLRYSQGDRSAALEHVRTAVGLAESAGAVYQTGVLRNDYGRLAYHAGDEDGARAAIEQALATSRAMRSSSMEYLCCLAQAELALLRDETEACRAALMLSMQIGRQQDYRNHTWWDADLMSRLYARALEFGIEVPYVQGMIRRRALLPPATAESLDAWPWPIRLYTFGRFGLIRDGQPVKFEGKAQKKALDLLKALAALGGREVSEQRLCDILWPDTDGDDARGNLKITLHRLRKIVGHEALVLQDSKLQLDPNLCWVDAWEFERSVNRMLANDSQLPVEGLRSAGDRALALYRGPFLADDAFAMVSRERLRGKLIRAIATAGGRLQGNGAHDHAIAWYERGIEIEPLAEPFYQSLMRIYHAQQRPAEGLGVYQRCKSMLAAHLQVSPSPETEALAQAMRGPGP